jgi:hypothetical protein
MRKLRYILLILCLCPTLIWAQRRYSVSDRWEYQLNSLSGFTSTDVNNKTDILNGLHAGLYTGSHHLLGFSAEGSWTAMVSNMPTARIQPGGGSGAFHLLYEYQYSGFIVQTGLGVNFQRVTVGVQDTAIYHAHMQDTWSNIRPVEFTLKHQFQERFDQSTQLYGQIPLYVGHYILSPLGIGYGLIGVKAGYAVWKGQTKMTAVGSTSGLYERYVGIWEEMDNHGFRKDVPLERTGDPLQIKLDIIAHAEMGYEFSTFRSASNYKTRPGDRIDCRIRLGAFVDFGILNINPGTKNTLYDLPQATIYDFPTYQMDHIFSTTDAKNFWMRNLFVGVRMTVLFGFPEKEFCILCNPWRH